MAGRPVHECRGQRNRRDYQRRQGVGKGSIPEDATRAKLAALYGMEEPVLFAEYEAEVQRRLELLRPPA